MTSTLRSETGGTTGVLIFIVSVIVAAALWQLLVEGDPQHRAQPEGPPVSEYVSPGAEVQFTFPGEWPVQDSNEGEGFYVLDLEGPRNSSIARILRERDGIDIEGAVTTVQLAEVINSSIANDYINMSFDVVSASTFELSGTLEQRKQELIEGRNATSGISFGEFTELEINGNQAMRYESRLIDGGAIVDSINYFILGETAEVDIVIFPASSNYAIEAESIVRNIEIRTNQEIEELQQQALDAIQQIQEAENQ